MLSRLVSPHSFTVWIIKIKLCVPLSLWLRPKVTQRHIGYLPTTGNVSKHELSVNVLLRNEFAREMRAI